MMTLQIANVNSTSQTNDYTWLYAIAALLVGFFLKVLYDELKSPKLEILAAPGKPYQIESTIQIEEEPTTLVIGNYNGYRLKVRNRQKRFLNCAAENCMTWIELDSAPEAYLLSWVGAGAEVTINVGDIRELDICARNSKTGEIIAPTERGYFEPSPRIISKGTEELKGKLRITCKNGKRAEKNITIKPTNGNQLNVVLS